jgi:TnpA family transposase
VGHPSRSERERLERFPARIAAEDLRACFALDAADRELVFAQRGPANRLGLAVQLCALRFCGFVPQDLAGLPSPALGYLAEQVDAAPHELLAYGARAQTRSGHLAAVRAHLGFRALETGEAAQLGAWLEARALEQEAPSALMALAIEHLRARRLVRPPLDQLTRMIAGARAGAEARVAALLAGQLPPARRAELDALVQVAPQLGMTPLAWLRTPARHIGVAEILRQAAKQRRLETLGAGRIDLSMLPPGRRRHLEVLGRRLGAQALARMDPARRHPVLLAALAELHRERGDELLDGLDKLLRLADGRARRRVDEQRRRTARQRDEHAELGRLLARILIEARTGGEDPLARAERVIGLARLKAAADAEEAALAPIGVQQLDRLHAAHGHMRPAVAAVLGAVTLLADPAEGALRDALALAAGPPGPRLLADAPLEALPRAWREWVCDHKGRPRRTRYELAVWFAVREALRAGRLHRPHSRRYADPAAFLLPREVWERDRAELALTFGRPLDGARRLVELEAEQRERVEALQAEIDAGGPVRLDGDRPVLTPIRAEPADPVTERLAARASGLLPRLELADLLVEVDRWTGYTAQLRHATHDSATARPEHLYAAIMAGATNLGPTAMAESSGLTYRKLAWASDWYLTDQHLAAANAVLVDYHHRLELAARWGAGQFSSSDGQRLPARGRSAVADPLAREFGWRRGGLTVLSWTSDQYSQYGTKVVSVAEREAAHTLDGILGNRTRLEPEAHTTDTHGATEIVFALFDLLGLRFIPRLADLPDVRRYRIGSPGPHAAERILQAAIRPQLITDRWDELLRVAGSLKRGWVTPSLLVTRLQAARAQTPLAAALREYGRLVRTNFLLAFMADEPLRRRVGAQLNKGETLHALRRHVAFGNRAQLPPGEADQHRHALCLELVVNAILVWNTRYLSAAVERIAEREPHLVTDGPLAGLAPVGHAHIRVHGRYRFSYPHPFGPDQLRPLREAGPEEPAPTLTPPVLADGDKH